MYIGEIKIPKDIFSLKKVEDYVQEKDKLFEDSENENLSDEERDLAYEKYKELEENEYNYYSMYVLATLIKEQFPKKEEEKYDVTKLCISEKTYQKMKNYDKKVFKTIHHFMSYSKEKIDKEIMWLHFSSGFSVDEKVKPNIIYLKEGYIKVLDV